MSLNAWAERCVTSQKTAAKETTEFSELKKSFQRHLMCWLPLIVHFHGVTCRITSDHRAPALHSRVPTPTQAVQYLCLFRHQGGGRAITQSNEGPISRSSFSNGSQMLPTVVSRLNKPQTSKERQTNYFRFDMFWVECIDVVCVPVSQKCGTLRRSVNQQRPSETKDKKQNLIPFNSTMTSAIYINQLPGF